MTPTSALSILLMLVLAAAWMIGLAGLRKRLLLKPEWSRKLLHTGGGLMALGLPWLFQSAGPVLILCAASLLGLLAVKRIPKLRHRLGGVVDGVELRAHRVQTALGVGLRVRRAEVGTLHAVQAAVGTRLALVIVGGCS